MKLIRTPGITSPLPPPKCILILSSPLRLGLQDDLFPRDMKDVYHVEKYFEQQRCGHYGGVLTQLSLLEIPWDKIYAL